MGEWMRPTSVKLGPRAERELSEIMDAFDPFFASRSHVIRWLTGLMHSLIFCERNLEEFAQIMQGIQCSTARYKSSSLTAVPKNGAHVAECPKMGPQRIDLSPESGVRPAKTATQFKMGRLEELEVPATYGFSFPAKTSPYIRLRVA